MSIDEPRRIDLDPGDMRAIDELPDDFWSTTVGRRLWPELSDEERTATTWDQPRSIEG